MTAFVKNVLLVKPDAVFDDSSVALRATWSQYEETSKELAQQRSNHVLALSVCGVGVLGALTAAAYDQIALGVLSLSLGLLWYIAYSYFSTGKKRLTQIQAEIAVLRLPNDVREQISQLEQTFSDDQDFWIEYKGFLKQDTTVLAYVLAHCGAEKVLLYEHPDVRQDIPR